MVAFLKIVVVLTVMLGAFVIACCQRCKDVLSEAVFDIAVIVAITAICVKVVERATGQ